MVAPQGGLDYDAPAIVYYVRVLRPGMDRPLYKIGITNFTVAERFYGRPGFTELWTEAFATGWGALMVETLILDLHSDDLYRGPKVLGRAGGDSELFTRDVLHKDIRLVGKEG